MKTSINRLFHNPHAGLGRSSVAPGLAFIVMFIINSTVFIPSTDDAPWRHIVLPFYGILMLLCGLGSGISGFAAVIKARERSWLVWLMLTLDSL